MQQYVEAASGQLPAQRGECAPTASLVKNDEFHAANITDELVFKLADDPGQLGLRPRSLQCAHQRDHVCHVAQCRCAQQA